MSHIKYKEMKANNQLTTYITKATIDKTTKELKQRPLCKCGKILLTGETICRYCKNDE